MSIHNHLMDAMAVYHYLSADQQAIVVKFTQHFCQQTEILVSPNVNAAQELGWTVAANAALVGGAQKTNCFDGVKWVYLDAANDYPGLDGMARGQ